MTAPAPNLKPGPPSAPATTGTPPPDGTGLYEPAPLRLLRVPQESWEAAAPVIQRNFEAIERHMRPTGGGSIGVASMARQFGWGHFKGPVAKLSDTRFTHNLGRIPEKIVHSVDLNGRGDAVRGDPLATGGSNTTPWTATEIYVRARDADGNFEFMVT